MKNVNGENKKKSIVVILTVSVLILVFACGFLVGFLCLGKRGRKVNSLITKIDKYAIYENKINDSVERAIVNALLSNDKYAKYYSKEEMQKETEQSSGKFNALGISFFYGENGLLDISHIATVAINSPAYKAGIKKGDKINAVKKAGGEYVSSTETESALNIITSATDSEEISLLITREGEFNDREFTIRREEYVTSFVSYQDGEISYEFISTNGEKAVGTIVGGGGEFPTDVAYIKLYLFEGDAEEEFAQAINLMKERGKTKLVLDLRDNGGGYMTTLQSIASYLIYNDGKDKNTIAIAINKKGKKEYYKTKKNNFYTGIEKIAVIANENTASASECLIGAMLYYGDCFSMDNLILTYNGSRENYSTFGKGIMQNFYEFSDGSAVKFTTAKIYQPDGETCIHDVGITQENPFLQTLDKDALSRAIEILG